MRKFPLPRVVVMLAIAAVMLVMVGCFGTSTPFKLGAASDGPLIAGELQSYVNADPSLSDADRTARLADVSALQAATATQKTIDYSTVAQAWAKVEPLYSTYINSDPALSASDKQLRLTTSSKFGQLIAQEQARHAAMTQ